MCILSASLCTDLLGLGIGGAVQSSSDLSDFKYQYGVYAGQQDYNAASPDYDEFPYITYSCTSSADYFNVITDDYNAFVGCMQAQVCLRIVLLITYKSSCHHEGRHWYLKK